MSVVVIIIFLALLLFGHDIDCREKYFAFEKGSENVSFWMEAEFFQGRGGVFHIGRAEGDEGGFEPPPSAVGRRRECRRLRFSSEAAPPAIVV